MSQILRQDNDLYVVLIVDQIVALSVKAVNFESVQLILKNTVKHNGFYGGNLCRA